MVRKLQSPTQAQPRVRNVAILMTDMHASTTFAESHGDWAAFEKRQKHNSLLLPLIQEHSGVLVEIVGDSLMAYFEDTLQAVRCASAMQHRLAEYNQTIAIDARDFEIHIRVGIHCGRVIIHEQMNQIALTGHAVNATARVEAADKKRTDQILLSDSVRAQIRNQSEFEVERIGSINGKGIDGLVLYRLHWSDKKTLHRKATSGRVIPTRPVLRPLPQHVLHASFAYNEPHSSATTRADASPDRSVRNTTRQSSDCAWRITI